jgi:hypothetical protein
MDATELAAAARKALEFDHEIGECSFRLLTPTRTQLRECAYRHQLDLSAGDKVAQALLQRYLLNTHLIGWTGVRNLHVLPDAGTDPLPWTREAVGLLLDAQPDWADQLGNQLLLRHGQRNAAIEEQAGN